MNALWLTRICAYRSSEYRLASAYNIINTKVSRQIALLRRFGNSGVPTIRTSPTTLHGLFLYEARSARHFWNQFSLLLPAWCYFSGRQARLRDPLNTLLNIGYHRLTHLTQSMIEQQGITTGLGIMHEARSATSTPLAYDLVELFRADIVDAHVLRFVRRKKKPLTRIDASVIAAFVHGINQQLERSYYLRDFHQCHSYRYYMELQILRFYMQLIMIRFLSPYVCQFGMRHDVSEHALDPAYCFCILLSTRKFFKNYLRRTPSVFWGWS